MDESIKIEKAGENNITTIRQLALLIWPEAYKGILSPEQLEYMLNLIYSEASLQEQIISKRHQFLIIHTGDKPAGFASWSQTPEKGIYKLHKLYVRTDIQGKGLGKSLLLAVKEQVKRAGATALQLNVNRHNKAIGFYEKNGFRILREEDIDIGNNYFMNDYVMETSV